MLVSISLKKNHYQVNLSQGKSIAIALDFNHQQPNHFDANKALKRPMSVSGFIGDTKQGGSCNVNELAFNPHCNGTHTETIGHICHQDDTNTTTINQLTLSSLLPCTLISIEPEQALKQTENYVLPFDDVDCVITKRQLTLLLSTVGNEQLEALVIRTLPNRSDKCHQTYNQHAPNSFFTTQAMQYLVERGVQHLIVDLPSIDRLNDQGLLNNHRLFWSINQNAKTANESTRTQSTITELAYINNELTDGFYFLNLQLPAFVNDAAPSQPILFDAKPVATNAFLKE